MQGSLFRVLCSTLVLLFLIIDSAFAQEDEVQEIIRKNVEQLIEAGQLDLGEDAISAAVVLPELYERRQFRPAWTDEQAIDDLFRAIQDSEQDGLMPTDYHQEALQGLRESMSSGPSAQQRAAYDLLMTDALVRLGYHLVFGKVDPEELDANWNIAFDLKNSEPEVTLQQAIDSGRLYDIIEEFKPQHFSYTNLKATLIRYRALQAAGGWETVPDGETLKKDMTADRIPTLRRRLQVTSDLPMAASTTSTTFDEELEAAVIAFQKRHGLDADGVVGKGTLAALNVSIEDRIDQIRVNLERSRWVLQDLDDSFIVVNIAGFRVYYVEDGEVVWESRAQVGRPYRATPIFKEQMTYLVINPTWTVPPGIFANDVLPAIKRDVGYLAQKNMKVVDGSGNIIDPGTINWSQYSGRDFPYMIRQDPGPTNALGRVKLMFPNKHLVYLHDTPSQSLFERSERAFSSGCIRVQEPFELAEIVLKDADKWSEENILKAVDSKKLQTVHLPEPVPVLLLYWTASLSPDGTVQFFNDVYSRDAAILDILNGPFKYRKRPIGNTSGS